MRVLHLRIGQQVHITENEAIAPAQPQLRSLRTSNRPRRPSRPGPEIDSEALRKPQYANIDRRAQNSEIIAARRRRRMYLQIGRHVVNQ